MRVLIDEILTERLSVTDLIDLTGLGDAIIPRLQSRRRRLHRITTQIKSTPNVCWMTMTSSFGNKGGRAQYCGSLHTRKRRPDGGKSENSSRMELRVGTRAFVLSCWKRRFQCARESNKRLPCMSVSMREPGSSGIGPGTFPRALNVKDCYGWHIRLKKRPNSTYG